MPRPHIGKPLRRLVRERAGGRCEYCLLHEDDRAESHQIDHILALKHGGATVSDNLALSCAVCNYYKGSDLASLDTVEGVIAPLFNPRAQLWREHFQLNGARLSGLTPTGRVTAALLRFNAEERLSERRELLAAGSYPINW